MNSKLFLWICIACFSLLPGGCDVMKQVGGAYNMSQCKYTYRSISNLNIAGMDLSKGVSIAHIPRITSLLTGAVQSVPLNLTLNINVENPNTTAAMLQGLQYIMSIDNVNFTSGTIDQG